MEDESVYFVGLLTDLLPIVQLFFCSNVLWSTFFRTLSWIGVTTTITYER